MKNPRAAVALLEPRRRGRPSNRQVYFGNGASAVHYRELEEPTTNVFRAIAGRSDGRLPTVTELQTKFEKSVDDEIESGESRKWSSIVRRPPNPLLQKRDEARAKDACPAAWAVRGYCKWDPEKYYDSPRPTCPSCEA